MSRIVQLVQISGRLRKLLGNLILKPNPETIALSPSDLNAKIHQSPNASMMPTVISDQISKVATCQGMRMARLMC